MVKMGVALAALLAFVVSMNAVTVEYDLEAPSPDTGPERHHVAHALPFPASERWLVVICCTA